MKIPVLLFVCFGLVICLTVFRPAVGQEDGPPRIFSDPTPTVTAEGQGYSYTWCEYTPIMTCYDTTVSTSLRPMDGPTRVAVPVRERVDYFPLITVLLFTVVSGVANAALAQGVADTSAGASISGGIVTTTSSG